MYTFKFNDHGCTVASKMPPNNLAKLSPGVCYPPSLVSESVAIIPVVLEEQAESCLEYRN